MGSDHEFSRNLPLSIMTIPEADATNATVVRADKIDEVRFERDLGSGSSRGIDKQPVNDGTPGRVEPLNAVLRFDLHRHDLVAIVKRRRSDHRCACRFDVVQNAPARQLKNTGSHEGVGRDRVAPVMTTVDREHSKAAPREEYARGRARATGSTRADRVVESS